MPSALHVGLSSIAALVFWGAIGLAFSRRLAPSSLALPMAPALGWALHNALALPLFRLIGFTPWAVWLSVAVVLAALVLARRLPANDEPSSGTGVPVWAYVLAAVLVVVPAIALFPKVAGDAVTLAAPIFDHSKVAIIDEMTRLGVPPGNPFFGEAGHDGPLAYYYLWHFSAAELAMALHVSGWEADIALSAFTAFASLSLMMGFAAWIGGRAAAVWVVPLAFAASLQPLLVAVLGDEIYYSVFLPPTGFGGWLFQTTWAPQHVASTSCVLLSSLLLVRLARRPTLPTLATLALVAAAGYESSVWVGGILFAAASPVLALILLTDASAQARRRFVVAASVAALLAAVLVFPFLRDQFLNAAARGAGSPIAFSPYEVFNFEPDELRQILDIPAFWLVLLVIEFPAIYIPGLVSLAGTLRRKLVSGQALLMTRMLAGLTGVSLLIPAFFTLTFVDNNDLGWRAVLPAVCVLTIFAATGLARWLSAGAIIPAGVTLLLVLLSLPRSFEMAIAHARGNPSASDRAFAATPALWAAVRDHSGPTERIANNPLFLAEMTPWPVNISWALFSNRRSCFAGSDLALPYTSLPRDHLEDIDEQFQRVFAGKGDANDVHDLATRYQCRVAVLTPQDGAWHNDPFASSGDYALVDEKAGAWKIYRVR